MKFMNFSLPGNPDFRLGVQVDERCLDLTAAHRAGQLDFLTAALLEDVIHQENGIPDLEGRLASVDLNSLEGFTIPLSEVQPRPPVLHPQKIIGIGLNYRDHAQEVGRKEPKAPLLFAMFANAIIGHNEAIVIPAITQKVDYEAELGVIIGRRGRHVPIEKAVDYVAGYTIVNDVSARDLQSADSQWIRGKSFDTFAPMGPCMVPTSVLGDGDGLDIQLRLNGQTMQKSNTRHLIFKVPDLISYISGVMTIEPGDVISTGTPGGVGFKHDPPAFLQPGDVVEIDLEGIGTLRNTVVRE